MSLLRGDALKMLSAAAAGALGARPFPALAQGAAKRVLTVNTFSFQLAIHVPTRYAVGEGIAAFPGYGPGKIVPIEQTDAITASVISGSADFGEDTDGSIHADAAGAGADLRIVGAYYRNVDLVFVVNSNKIKTFKDFENPQNVIAVNNKNDSTELALVGPLLKAGVDVSKLTVVEIGGSGSRMRALLSDRVQCVPIHFDQAAEVEKQGAFKTFVEPWKFYKKWVNEVIIARASWLKDPQNARATVDLLKASMLANRRANRDFSWYLDNYRKYATLPDAKTATEQTVRPLWHTLSAEMKAWPDNNVVTAADFEEYLLSAKALKALPANVNLTPMFDPSFAQQAVRELGRQGL